MSSARIAVAVTGLALPGVALWSDAALAWSRGGSGAVGPMSLGLLAASGVASVVAIGALFVDSGRGLLSRSGARAGASVLAATVALVVVELVAWSVTGVLLPGDHLHRPGLRRVFHPDPRFLRGVSGPGRFTVNAEGVRAAERPASGVRLLAIGGSTTQCDYLDDDEAWPAVLGSLLTARGPGPVWVGNAGFDGATTVDHLRFLERSRVVTAIDAAILLVGVNDLLAALEGRDLAAIERGCEPAWQRSASARGIRALVLRQKWVDDDGAVIAAARMRRSSGVIVDDAPDLRGPLVDYRGRLERIAKAVRRRGAQPIFVTQPTLWSRASADAEGELTLGYLDRAGARFLSSRRLGDAMALYNEAMRDVCRVADAALIDLSEMNGRRELFYDDCHFTEAGSRVVAGRIAAWFVARPRHAR